MKYATLFLTLGVLCLAFVSQSFAVEVSQLVGVWQSDEMKIKIDSDGSVAVKNDDLRASGTFRVAGDRVSLSMQARNNNRRVEIEIQITNITESQFSARIISVMLDGQPENPERRNATFHRIN
jgi:hypothetical protein